MRKIYILLLAFLPFFTFAQLKQIAFAELTPGSNMFFGAEMTPTTITITVQGPSDRYLAFGFGTGMASGNDALIWSTLGTGVAPLQIRDHRMIGTGSEPTVDAQQDWTEISNTVNAGNRTIVATRALSTGDANDVTFNFAATTQNLFWAKGPSPTNQLQNHGGGNRASGIVRNWVLVDQTPPTVNTFTPADNANGVSLTQNLIMSFSENISWGTGSISLYDGSNNLIQTISNGSPGVGLIGSTLNWNPTANFVVNTQYYVHVDPTAIKDAANNFFVGFNDNTSWNFNTNDITAPTILGALTPADNAAGVSQIQNLSVTFNENVQAGTGLIELFDETGLVESFDVTSSPNITISGATVTIDPTSNFTINTDYYVQIANGAIEDLSGNNFAGISNNTSWNFNTNDLVAPTAIAPYIPVNNSVNVDVSAPQFILMFTEDVEFTGTGGISLFSGTSTLVDSYILGSPLLQVSGNTITFQTSLGSFLDETDYYVIIDPGFITDTSGNAFAGFTTATDWFFTTGDYTAPILTINTPFSPLDDAINVPVNTQLMVNFSEDVVLGNGSFYLVNESLSTTEEFNIVNGSDISVAGNTVMMTPASPLNEGTTYHITADADAVRDASVNGNTFAGFSSTTQWNFTTEDDASLNELTQNGISWNGTILSFTGNQTIDASLYDASGKLVAKQLKQTNDLSNLQAGIYLVSLNKENGIQTIRIYVD